MPSVGSIATGDKGWSRSPAKGIFSLILTVLFCLPSLIGGTAFLVNLMLYRNPEEWGQLSGALVALGGVLGRPFVAVAAVVGATVAFRSNVSPGIKYAHLSVVVLATIASLFFLSRFGM